VLPLHAILIKFWFSGKFSRIRLQVHIQIKREELLHDRQNGTATQPQVALERKKQLKDSQKHIYKKDMQVLGSVTRNKGRASL
jgi:hypothetical protein